MRGAIQAITGSDTLSGHEETPAETTFTLYPSLDGTIVSSNTNYATARNGGTLTTDEAGFFGEAGIYAGQGTPKYIPEGFLSFDTSAVTGTIQSVTLSLYGINNSSVTDFTVEVRLYDWGTSLTTADWVPGANLAAMTLLASWSTAGYAASYNAFTSEAAFLSNINQSGFTRMVVVSNQTTLGNAPANNSYVGFSRVTHTGTSQDPKLVIVTEV